MGYYGFDNIGDEAVLQAIIQQIQKNIPACTVAALSNKPGFTSATYGIKSYDRWKPLSILKALLWCDVFVAGGGSLLQDITGAKSIKYYLYLLKAAQLLRKKVFYYAQGIGPVNSEENRFLTAKILNKIPCLTVRDNDAALFLQELGIDKERIVVTCDPVLALKVKEDASMLPMGLKMAFAVRDCKDLNIEALARVADHFAKKGWTIVFLPFCSPNDTAVSKMIMAKMQEKAFLAEGISLPCDMMSAISACNFTVGIRLHALVMSAACAVPFAALSYDPKIDGFCRELGLFPAAAANEQDAEIIIKGIERELANKANQKLLLRQKKAEWQETAALNAILLQKCAENKIKLPKNKKNAQYNSSQEK